MTKPKPVVLDMSCIFELPLEITTTRSAITKGKARVKQVLNDKGAEEAFGEMHDSMIAKALLAKIRYNNQPRTSDEYKALADECIDVMLLAVEAGKIDALQVM